MKQINVWKSQRNNKKHLGTSIPWVLIYGKRQCDVMRGKVETFGWLENSSKSDLTVQCVFCMGCLSENWGSGTDRGRRGLSRRVPSVCFTLWYLTVCFESTTGKVLRFPCSACSMHYPKCDQAPRVKQRQAVSSQYIISSLSGLAKQGDSYFNRHALLIQKESESPFCWRKVGNRSTNLQISKNSVKWLYIYVKIFVTSCFVSYVEM